MARPLGCFRRPLLAGSGILLLFLAGAVQATAAEQGGDGRFERRDSSHFSLLQDVGFERRSGRYGSLHFERQVLEQLERAYDRLDALLGLRPSRRLRVVIDDPAAFDARFGGAFGFAAAGFYAGIIRVRGATDVTPALAQTLHHELVHAAFDAAAPSLVLPAWLNEGLAEWFEHRALGVRYLAPQEWELLRSGLERGSWPSASVLWAPSFAGLSDEGAAMAYLTSRALIDRLVRRGGERRLRDLIEHVLRLRDVERALRQSHRTSFAELDAAARAALR